jgi:hypothetical protein
VLEASQGIKQCVSASSSTLVSILVAYLECNYATLVDSARTSIGVWSLNDRFELHLAYVYLHKLMQAECVSVQSYVVVLYSSLAVKFSVCGFISSFC